MACVNLLQRDAIVIDACHLGESHSSLMQQGCLLTQGFYMKPNLLEGLMEYLMV